jgi:hypothetical protein
MMKQRYNFLTVLLVIPLVLPAPVFAQDGGVGGTGLANEPSAASERIADPRALLCTKIDEVASTIEKRIGEREAKLGDRKKERKIKLDERKTDELSRWLG